jgi:mycothiol synthase
MTVNTSTNLLGTHQLAELQVNLRLFCPETDYEKISQILMAVATLPWEESTSNADELRTYYRHLINCDLAKDLAIVESNNQPLAYTRVFWVDLDAEPFRNYHLSIFLDPSCYGKGVHDLLFQWAEARAMEISSEQPTDRKMFLKNFVFQQDAAKVAVVEASGYKNTRYSFAMKRPLDNIPIQSVPAGIVVHPVFPSQYRQVFEADKDAFRDHYGFSESWANYERWVDDPHFQPWLWQIAWDGNEVAGCVLNYIDHDENERLNHLRGYTENISVGRKWRGKGIAKALICRSMEMFKTLGMQEVALGVDALNPTGALKLYEGLGYVTYKSMVEYTKPLNLGFKEM